MSLPKKRQINITPNLVGQDRIDELMNFTDPVSTGFPSGINIKDLETGMRDFIKELNFTIDGELVPVIFFPGDRWSSFAKTWKYVDEDENIVFPLISINRSAPPAPGTSIISRYVIPGRKTFQTFRMATFDGVNSGVDIFSVPQPIPIDLKFQIKIFSHYIQDTNRFGELLITDFSSRQSFQKIKGRFMPIIMDGDPSDESTIEDFEGDRFYSQSYPLILQGYLQDENEFKITPAVNKILVVSEVDPFKTISGTTVLSGT
ncbi:hypothetical protein COB55_04480 [Candidatus Wolfebacteria bacterium]|nr:MAG: hypothetical protein COB55_04480 [Candidatus Wolfebacteria bacterium]